MKKSLIATAVLASLFLTACNDKELQTKLEQQTQTIAQLIQQTEQLKGELAAEKDKAAKILPALQPLHQIIYRKDAEVPYKNVLPSDEDDGGSINFVFSTLDTGLPWLNELLLNAIYAGNEYAPENIQQPTSLANLPVYYDKLFTETQNNIAENKLGNIEYISSADYLFQRGKYALFSVDNYEYTGGAHGMGTRTFINVDLADKKAIELKDIFDEKGLVEVKNLLWKAYTSDAENEPFVSQQDFYASKNFYLNEDGITFYYQVYALGPYVDGAKELRLSWWELAALVKPEFQAKNYFVCLDPMGCDGKTGK